MKILNHIEIEFLSASKKSNEFSIDDISEEWEKIRLKDFNFDIFIKLIEYDQNSDYKSPFLDNYEFNKFRETLTWLLILINDLLTFERELKFGKYDHNLIYKKMIKYNINLIESTKILIEEIKIFKFKTEIMYRNLRISYPFHSDLLDQMYKNIDGIVYWTSNCMREK